MNIKTKCQKVYKMLTRSQSRNQIAPVSEPSIKVSSRTRSQIVPEPAIKVSSRTRSQSRNQNAEEEVIVFHVAPSASRRKRIIPDETEPSLRRSTRIANKNM